MKKQENKIIEIRSKKRVLGSGTSKWSIKPSITAYIWKHYCAYSEEETTVHFVKKTKRGFTFSVYFAGKYNDYFVSRSDCEIIYELEDETEN